ncbi:MAG TPA: NAD(P)H-dependent glycerol-3-phosphate dehydrogenase [Bacillales bacterium]|nr:NAD(P)H-dependent glycerol-3-phosphate dehydrogenase [Bacillales bacterium]
MANTAVFGMGSWGTALATVLSDNGHQVKVWGRREDQVEEINTKHTNERYLPGISLPDTIMATTSMEEAVEDADTIVLVVPTKAMRTVLHKLNNHLSRPVALVHASKGIETDTLKRISEIISEELDEDKRKNIAVLSGPSHAEEVVLRQPTTVTVSSTGADSGQYIQDLFINRSFRVYTNPDMVGVELGGALKNIIALGAGLSDGIGFGDNAKAALMTRGLAEIARLGTKMGANPMTFAGLAGMGDLIATCTSAHSRNWRAGNLLGKGKQLQEVLDNMGMVVEGVKTTEAAYRLSEREGVEMPITNGLYDVLFSNQNPKQAVEGLMGRMRTDEVDDLSSLFAKQIQK